MENRRPPVPWMLRAERIGSDVVVFTFRLGPAPGAMVGLTPAERIVATQLASGLSYAQAARQRDSSPRTIANQAASIFRKLRVGSRAALIARLGGSVRNAD